MAKPYWIQVLESLRVQACLTQPEMAIKLGVPSRRYEYWLRGGKMYLDEAIVICKILEVPITYLIGKTDG